MSLSDRDREVLKSLEASLSAEDPKLAAIMTKPNRTPKSGNIILGGVLFLVGMVTLISSLATKVIFLGLLGFIVSLVGTLMIFSYFSAMATTRENAVNLMNPKRRIGFFEGLENRWDRRNFDNSN